MNTNFTFDSGQICLDFLATVVDRDGAADERLADPKRLADWIECAGLSTKEVPVANYQLRAAVELREAAYDVITAVLFDRKPSKQSVSCLNRWASQPGFAPVLSNDARGATWIAKNDIAACFTHIARDVIELLTGPDQQRIRKCSGAACSMLFIDTSRAQNRRWCSMERCGNRSKKASFRRRHASN